MKYLMIYIAGILTALIIFVIWKFLSVRKTAENRTVGGEKRTETGDFRTDTPEERTEDRTDQTSDPTLPENLTEREREVIDLIIENGPLTTGEILEKIDSSRSYLSTVLNDLEEQGILRETGKEGKKILYGLNRREVK